MKPVVLVIMDGIGISKRKEGNAVLLANTPNYNELIKNYPSTTLKAAGTAVGMPPNDPGDAEVGHLNIGAGRVVYGSFFRINNALADKSFYQNKAFLDAVENCKVRGSSLHLIGCLQKAGIHSHIYHLLGLLKLAKDNGVEKVYIHIFTDGIDSDAKSARQLIATLKEEKARLGDNRIATVIGRYFAMDRDEKWKRTELAYNALVNGVGLRADSSREAVDRAYEKGECDDKVKPTIIGDFDGIKDGDSVIFFNFRKDRARQLTRAFVEPDFNKFRRKKVDVNFVCMTHYYKGVENNAVVAFKSLYTENLLGEVLSRAGLKQLRVAEQERCSAVGYFLNGEKEMPFEGEDRICVDSPKIAYHLRPGMNAYQVTKKALEAIYAEQYDIIIVNLANCDVVGHTGELDAAVTAVEVVDDCMGRVFRAVKEVGGISLVTSSHGNIEEMIDRKTKQPIRTNSRNDVLFIISDAEVKLNKGGILADIAPTVIDILELDQPEEMTGESLIRR
ncbi:2,3-bisphosphoglycerate-independent phosphoglycerate mutase [Candidatus Woesearchaeota archaeon]|nr:2,3-bisphosphoglycerate-independent phosphoglycerate mutase [Candidatus Woesearchaeota archaeon]